MVPWSCHHCACILLVLAIVLIPHIPSAAAGPAQQNAPGQQQQQHWYQRWRREEAELMESADLDQESDYDNDNCSEVQDPPPPPYNDTCEFVKAKCEDKYELFNYLRFSVCSLGKVCMANTQA